MEKFRVNVEDIQEEIEAKDIYEAEKIVMDNISILNVKDLED